MAPEQNPNPPTAADDLAARMYPNEAQAKAQSQTAATVPDTRTPDEQAASMYPDMKRESVAAAPQVTREEPAEHEPPAGQVSVDDLVNQEQTLADQLYADGGSVPDSAEDYGAKLGEAFDQLSYQARHDRNEADIAALSEGRQQSAALLHELRVPLHDAGEITRTVAEWHSRDPNDEGANLDAKARTIAELEREWGKESAARIQLAQRVAQDACKRLPWLSNLLAAGAGNDPRLIRQFAAIGLRNARRAKR